MTEAEHNGDRQELSNKGKTKSVVQTTPNIFATRHFTPNVDRPYSRSHYRLAMAEVKKQERDFTPEVDALLPETQSLSEVCSLPFRTSRPLTSYVCAVTRQSGRLSEALEKLLALEKQTRNVRPNIFLCSGIRLSDRRHRLLIYHRPRASRKLH